MSEHIRLAICVASSGQCRTQFAYSLAGLIGSAQTFKFWPQVESVESTINVQESSVIHSNREALIQKSLEWDATHILFFDDDMLFPPEAIQSLFSRRHDIVITNYPRRGYPLTPTASSLGGKLIDTNYNSTGIEEARFGGFGVALFNADVFRKVPRPWFLPQWSEEHQIYTTEDLPFFDKAREYGYRCWVDHDASKMIGHAGSWVFKWPTKEEIENGK